MSRRGLDQIIPQGQYLRFAQEAMAEIQGYAGALDPVRKARLSKFKGLPFETLMAGEGPYASPMGSTRAMWAPAHERDERVGEARDMIKARVAKYVERLQKAGLTSGLGYNFFDLRGPAYLLYPVQTPFRNSIGRYGRVNDGYGTAAHWKATRDFGTQYGMVLEGQRNAIATPDEHDYLAAYKEIGVERGVTFTAEFAGEGYTDNVADEHLRGAHELWLQEESIILNGNPGTGSGDNGYALGTAPAPVGVVHVGGALVDTKYYTAYVVCITALGYANNNQYGYLTAPTVSSGLVPQYTRTNQDGSQTVVNGGTSAISVASNTVQASSPNLSIVFTVGNGTTDVPRGAVAFAWYIDKQNTNTTVIGNAKLAAITTVPNYTAAADPTGTQTADATGLNSDHSFNTSDFVGLLGYAAATTGALWEQMNGASFTSGGDGSIVEVDDDLAYIWDQFQAQPSAIWCSADTKVAFDKAVRSSGVSPSAYRFDYARDAQNNLLGGYVVSAYQSKFSIDKNGGNALPVRIHPMIPKGTMYYDVDTNPYPHSRIPFVRGMYVQRDYYSIEWPLVTRQWTFGTYAHEVLAHTIPWICAARTGIGPFSS